MAREHAPPRGVGAGRGPNFRPSRYQPEGQSLATAITVPEGEVFGSARRALEVITRIHGDGALPPIRVEADRRMLEPAAFERDLATGRALGILVNPNLDYTELEFAHEVGHLLDQQTLGNRGEFASSSPRLRPWREAVRESGTYRQLRAMRRQRHVERDDVRIRVDPDMVEYLLRDRELFARSYAQYIAVSGNDEQLLGQFGAQPAWPYPTSWPEQEFEKVAQALEQIFLEAGWLQ